MGEQYEVKVAVEKPLFTLFSYLSTTKLAAGVRVVVPFGRGKAVGVVREACLYESEENRSYQLKKLQKVIDEEPVYSSNMLRLADFLSSYYIHPIGEVLKAMLPGGSNLKRQLTWEKQENSNCNDMFLIDAISFIFKRKSSLRNPSFLKNLEKISEKLQIEPIKLQDALVANRLLVKRWHQDVQTRETKANIDDFHRGKITGEIAKVLTPLQSSVFEKIRKKLGTGYHEPILLHGITGSGKTEIYLQMIAKLLSLDEASQTLVMVPEISLTPQMTAVFEKRFPGRVAVVHSNLSNSDRWRELEKTRRGECSVLIGPRSSIFAPFKNLAQIIIDEEHDTSYKQNTGLMYNGRDVAIFRAKLENAGVLLGSATPSLESYHNALSEKYSLLELPERVGSRTLPSVEVSEVRPGSQKGVLIKTGEGDRNKESREELFEDSIPISPDVIRELRENHKKGLQSIVLVNRRGYAYYLFDLNSREALQCPQCSISLTVHKKSTMLHCHYCDFSQSLAQAVKENPSSKFVSVGYGSEKAADMLEKLMPGARIARVDSDILQKKDLLPETLGKFRDGEIDVLVGTQILAKGHDFSKVTLLCILEVDQLLNLPDLRAGERTFQLMVQASGRAGRGELPGKVIVQTSKGLHPIVGAALRHDYGNFIEYEMSYRKVHNYPPFSRMVQIELNSTDPKLLLTQSNKIESWITKSLDDDSSPLSHIKVLGPTSPPIEVIRNRHRKTILFVCKNRKILHQGVREMLAVFGKAKGDLRIKVDVDPQTLL